MKPYYRLLFLGCLCCGLLLAPHLCRAAADPDGSWVPTRPDTDANTRKGFDHFYNLDYDKATRDFEAAQQAHPNDPFAVNHTLAAVTFKELYRIGALDTEAYAADNFMTKKPLEPLDPTVRERVKQLTTQSLALSQAKLDKNPNDVDALYARGATRALQSTYIGLADKAWFAALRIAVAARHDNERVLELDPNYVDAKLVVGTHNYVMGSLPWGVKVAVALVGLSGTKEKGLQYLRELGQSDGENAVDAKVVLSLFLRREHQYDEARGLMEELATRFPRNYLFSLEVANLMRDSGRWDDAAADYRKIWQNGRDGKYGTLHYELAAWGLGELLRSRKDYAGAAAAYELTNEVSNPDPETLQKANLVAGEMYDLLGKRDMAVRKYQVVVAENSGTPLAEEARRFMREAYRE